MKLNERITIESSKPRIRGLGISVWEIYRKLVLVGMTGEDVLREHPGLLPEDLQAVRAYILAGIKSRTHDDLTGRSILAKDQLKHGRYYKGRCRNATIARWNANEQCFYHWRKPFDRIFLDTIKYPTDEVELFWDTFWVVDELSTPRFEIPFHLEAVFTRNPADLLEYNEEMWYPVERVIDDGTTALRSSTVYRRSCFVRASKHIV
jgi:uncharacterized protein (DUF433 family)